MRIFQTVSAVSFFSFLILIFVGTPGRSVAQVQYRSDDFTLTIKGTSSVHDWEVTSDKGKLEAVLLLGNNSKITGLSGLHFTVESKSLKSGRNSMDNNTYKALKTNTYNSISFNLTSAKILQLEANSYQLTCLGDLTIAGTTRETELLAGCKLNADKTFTCSGIKKLKMTDFNVKPPTALMGTIKTGNEISVVYSMNIGK